MEQEQDKPRTIKQIRTIMKEWQAERMGSRYAMREVEIVIKEHDAREQRLKTISEDARRDREAVGL